MKNLILLFAVMLTALCGANAQDYSIVVELQKWQVAPTNPEQLLQIDSVLATGKKLTKIVCTSSRAGSVSANQQIANKRAAFYGEKYGVEAIAIPFTDSLGMNEADNRVAIFFFQDKTGVFGDPYIIYRKDADPNNPNFSTPVDTNSIPDTLIMAENGVDVVINWVNDSVQNVDTTAQYIQLDTLPTPQLKTRSTFKAQPIACDCTKELAYKILAKREYETTAEVWKNGLNKANRATIRKQMYKSFGRWKYNEKVYKRCMYFAAKNKAKSGASAVTTNYKPNSKSVSYGQSKKSKRFYPKNRKNGLVFALKSRLACRKGTRL